VQNPAQFEDQKTKFFMSQIEKERVISGGFNDVKIYITEKSMASKTFRWLYTQLCGTL